MTSFTLGYSGTGCGGCRDVPLKLANSDLLVSVVLNHTRYKALAARAAMAYAPFLRLALAPFVS